MYHIRIDVKKVQDFIFRLPKLKAMLGANSLVGEFFAKELPALRKKYTPITELTSAVSEVDVKEIAGSQEIVREFVFDDVLSLFNDGTICSAGGHFEAVFVDDTEANDFSRRALDLADKKLPGLQVSAFIKNFEPSSFDIFDKKKPIPVSTTLPYVIHPDSPWWRISGDGVTPAVKATGQGTEQEFVSNWILELEKQADQFYTNSTGDFLAPVNKMLGAYQKNALKDLETLAKTSGITNNNMIALISIDGNGMGKRFGEVRDKLRDRPVMEAFIRMELFWQKERYRVRKALIDAIKPISAPGQFLIFMLGGDDLLLAMVPEKAFDFIRDFEKSYTNKIDGASLCTGIAFVKYGYPIAHACELSQSLLESAKVRSKTETNQENKCCVDWHILTDTKSRDISTIRRAEYMVEYPSGDTSVCEILSGRPYTIEKAYEHWKNAGEIIPKKENVEERKDGLNRIKRFQGYLRAGKDTAKQWGKMLNIEESLYAYPDTMFESAKVYMNNALDTIELIDFHKLKGGL
jgi:hypothetical protein